MVENASSSSGEEVLYLRDLDARVVLAADRTVVSSNDSDTRALLAQIVSSCTALV